MAQRDQNKPPRVRVDVRMLLPIFGILFAPFIGFLISPNLGLGILVLSLTVVGWATWTVSQQVPPQQQRTLRFGAILNFVMAVAALLLLLYRL